MSFISIIATTAGAVVAVVLVLLLLQASARKSLRNSAQSWLQQGGFTEHAIAFGPGDAVGVDYSRKKVALFTNGNGTVVDFSELVSVEVTEDGSTVTKTSRAGQLGGAAIGAIAFGGAGAVVGAIGAPTTARQMVGRASINVITTRPDFPFAELKVFQEQPVEKSGFVYQQLSQDLMPWYARLKAIIERHQ